MSMIQMAQDEDMVSRWSAAAYVTTALCLLGIVAGMVFLILGDNRSATLAAAAALLGPFLSAGIANRNGWLSASDSDGSLGSARAGSLGAWAGLFFLYLCYVIKTWSLDHDAPVIWQQDQLTAAIFLVLAIAVIVPRLYRLRHGSPQELDS